MNDSLIGVVMCGGESSRMGSDKGLLRLKGKSWASIAFVKLEHIIPDVYLSINQKQVIFYRQIFPLSRLIIDSVECKGPLAGLLSVHHSKPQNDILLLACDMVNMDVETLMIVVKEYKRDKTGHDFYVCKNRGEFEPLAAIYTSSGIRKVIARYQEQRLMKHSMKHILENGSTCAIDTAAPSVLTNFNSPADLSLEKEAFM